MDFTRREQIIIVCIILLVIGGTGAIFWKKQKAAVPSPLTAPATQVKEFSLPKNIVVHISGAVLKAGVVTMPAGSRVVDALKAAGGPAVGADVNVVNMAALLVDGQQILIPSRGEGASGSQSVRQGVKPANEKISINTADAAALDTLSGIGPAMAQKIIDYRTAKGPFRSLEDLKNVPGIGEGKYQSIKEKITL